jgi:hypothetical protein
MHGVNGPSTLAGNAASGDASVVDAHPVQNGECSRSRPFARHVIDGDSSPGVCAHIGTNGDPTIAGQTSAHPVHHGGNWQPSPFAQPIDIDYRPGCTGHAASGDAPAVVQISAYSIHDSGVPLCGTGTTAVGSVVVVGNFAAMAGGQQQ